MFITFMHYSSILLNYCLILMRSFTSYYGYPEHNLPTSRVPVSVEGCGEVTTLCSIGLF